MQTPNFLLSVTLAIGLTFALGMSVEAAQLAPGLSAVEPVGDILLVFDDMGKGTITVDGGAPSSLPGTLMDDPADPACPASCSPVLTYPLPEPVVSGDVAILTPDGSETAAWLRFTDDAGTISGAATGMGTEMIFYFEPPFASNIGGFNFVIGPSEVVTDGTATFNYQPGGVPFPQNNEFIGSMTIVPAVPEPTSLALLGSFLAAMGVNVHRRRRQ
jgi:hypothetical protein